MAPKTNVIRPEPWAAPRPSSRPPRAGPTDAELIDAVVSGNTKVASQIHDRLVGVIDQSLCRVLGSRGPDHDDLVQQSFEQIIRSLAAQTFAGHCSLSTWASRITTHVALNALRSRCRERRVISRTDDATEFIPDSHSESGERAHARTELRRAHQVLMNMPREKSEVIVMHDVHGLSLNEIAALLGVTVAAAQSRLVRGRGEFQRLFERAGRHV